MGRTISRMDSPEGVGVGRGRGVSTGGQYNQKRSNIGVVHYMEVQRTSYAGGAHTYLVIVSEHPAEPPGVLLSQTVPELKIVAGHPKLVLVVPLPPAVLPQPHGVLRLTVTSWKHRQEVMSYQEGNDVIHFLVEVSRLTIFIGSLPLLTKCSLPSSSSSSSE